MIYVNSQIGYSFTEDEENYIVKKYTANHRVSATEIAKEFNVDSSVIKRILKKHNISIKNQHTLYSFDIDESFFEKIDTEEKAYILGFLAADGYITSKNYTICFKLSEKDDEILYKFKKALKTEANVKYYFNKNNNLHPEYKTVKSACLAIKNKKIWEDLVRLGITPKKTEELFFPKKEIPHSLVHHYIRGFFDGDGSVYEMTISKSKGEDGSRRTYKCIGISIIGKHDFLEDIGNIIGVRKVNGDLPVYKTKMMHQLQYSGFTRCKQVYDFLYKDATIYLERKKNKFDEIFSKNLSKNA